VIGALVYIALLVALLAAVALLVVARIARELVLRWLTDRRERWQVERVESTALEGTAAELRELRTRVAELEHRRDAWDGAARIVAERRR